MSEVNKHGVYYSIDSIRFVLQRHRNNRELETLNLIFNFMIRGTKYTIKVTWCNNKSNQWNSERSLGIAFVLDSNSTFVTSQISATNKAYHILHRNYLSTGLLGHKQNCNLDIHTENDIEIRLEYNHLVNSKCVHS